MAAVAGASVDAFIAAHKEEWTEEPMEMLDEELMACVGVPEAMNGYPLQFSSVKEEVDFIATLHALNFAASTLLPFPLGKDIDCQSGVLWKVVQGCLTMYVGGKRFNADMFNTITALGVETAFGFKKEEEVLLREDTPGLYTTRESGEAKYVEKLVSLFHSMGRKLANLGVDGFHSYIQQFGVERLEQDFACFQDRLQHMSEGNEETVYIASGLQNLMAHLTQTVGPKDATFDYRSELEHATIRPDSAVCHALQQLGALDADANTRPGSRDTLLRVKIVSLRHRFATDRITLQKQLWMLGTK